MCTMASCVRIGVEDVPKNTEEKQFSTNLKNKLDCSKRQVPLQNLKTSPGENLAL